MNDDERRQLERELREAGASPPEVSELMPVAAGLQLLERTKPAIDELRNTRQQKVPALKYIAIGGATVMATLVLILFSELVLPGSLLYPVQKFSDNTAIALHPGYRATVMMKRARQVRLLVERHAPPDTVLATLADYQSVASTYRVNATNYQAFEYCKDSLQQAAAIAPSSEQPAISNTLSSLKDI